MLALAAITPAFAQTTGSQDFDQQIVVTGTKTKGVGGVITPDTSKTKVSLSSAFIQHETPGQSIDDVINMIPGVSFQNNDPYGSAGGTLNIRGFDSSRIAQTWDGFTLNDTGNYAIYSNQQMDSELIDQVTVSLGSTDVDAPSASATGSTVNYTTRNPSEDFHVRVSGSAGEYQYFRLFGVVDTGTFTPFGTRAFLSASKATNNNVFNNLGKINKTQINGKIYQPIGSNGDFISIAGHYNRNINNFFGSVPLQHLGTATGTGSGNSFPTTKDGRFYDVADCLSGKTACAFGTAYDYRYNPSKTANVRVNSRFSLTDKLTLTADAAYQYTLANGGGTATANEGYNPVTGTAGYFGSTPYLGGVDLNGDGDTKDSVLVSAPSNTNTNRAIANIGLRYDFTPDQTVRIGYSLDYGHHRQTGEITKINALGFATNPFSSEDPIYDSTGHALQKRDRNSFAILNQAFGEYRGKFLDDRLTLTAGVRAPFFTRKLQNYCFATNTNGGVVCSGQNAATDQQIAIDYPNYQAPQKRTIRYNKVLPSAGVTFNILQPLAIYANYSKGLQVPGTDNLYNAFGFAPGTDGANGAKPETTDNFDTGVRYTTGKLQATVDGWYTIFHDRLASSYDLDTNTTIYRNLGTVHKYGVDADVSYKPVPEITLYAFGSYLKSKILDNVQATATTYYLTAGKRESGSPTYNFGGRIEGHKGPVTLGVEAKRTGPRYINDQNLPVVISGVQVFGAKAPAYTVVNLDARVSMEWTGMGKDTWLQLNVTNLFDKLYVGGFSGTTVTNSLTYAQIGAPRAVSGTINFGF
ncbi:TonB-dependent receptor [Sphingomonas abietis]|uniref:TonB-dependent receptor n=1 Tax=Sphingomonas abietis TaxID=3012344 RepID=A0ABY7NL36_9SPHN|nr:TonB-dependent receptor [Sphingomonas abietis]WBO21680.1 TonB-dependent receptor [Sphingomonas abietis]